MRVRAFLPILIISTLLIDSSIAQAQTSGWDLTLTTGGSFRDVTLVAVENDTLVIAMEAWVGRSWTSSHDTLRLDVGIVEVASRSQGANFGTGGLIGAGAALGILGAMAVPSLIEDGCAGCGVGLVIFGPAFGVGGFLVGGIIGAVIDDDAKYDLSGKDRPIRTATLHWIITSGRFAD